jgi:hypothetical protein
MKPNLKTKKAPNKITLPIIQHSNASHRGYPNLTSFLIVSRKTLVSTALLLKTLVFRSFQIVQLTSIVINANALRLGDALQDMFSHHILTELFIAHS